MRPLITANARVGLVSTWTKYFIYFRKLLGRLPGRYMGDSKGVILIVDDSVTDRMILSSFLKKMGFSTHEVADGKQALEFLMESSEVQLKQLRGVFCDLMMPEMDGMTLLETIREYGGCNHIPFIMVSSQDDVFFQNDTKRFGGVGYIVKPVSIDRVSKMLAQINLA